MAAQWTRMFRISGRLPCRVVDIHGCRGIPYLKPKTGVGYSGKEMNECQADIRTSLILPRKQLPGAVLLDEESKGLQDNIARPISAVLR